MSRTRSAIALFIGVLVPSSDVLAAEVAAVAVVDVAQEASVALHAEISGALVESGRTVLDRAATQASIGAFLKGKSLLDATDDDIAVLRTQTGVDQLVVVRLLSADAAEKVKVFQIRAYSKDGAPRVRVKSAADTPELAKTMSLAVAEILPAQPAVSATPAIGAVAPAPAAGVASAAPRVSQTSDTSVSPDIEKGSLTVSTQQVTTERDEKGEVKKVTTNEASATSGLNGNVGLSVSSKTLTRKEPASSAETFGLTVGGGGIFSDSFVIGIATLGFRARSLQGQFPGADGGFLNALDLAFEIDGSLGGAAMSVPGTPRVSVDPRTRRVTTTPGVSQTKFLGFGGGQAFLEVAYNLTYFSSMNPQTLEQGGFGIRLGAMGGGRVNAQLEGSGSPQLSPLVGPVLGLEFPTYNVGTAALSSIAFNAIVIPLPSALSVFGSLGFMF